MKRKESKSPNKYTLEFKKSSAQLAMDSDQSMRQVANSLAGSESALSKWIKLYVTQGSSPLPVGISLEEEVKQLRKENIRLRQERDILKKAAAYFANETM